MTVIVGRAVPAAAARLDETAGSHGPPYIFYELPHLTS